MRRLLTVLFAVAVIGCGRPPALDPNTLAPDQRIAFELAEPYERDKRLNWGRPIGVDPLGPGWEQVLGERADGLQVRFRTPDDEIPLLGERAILVNVKTQKAILAPRD